MSYFDLHRLQDIARLGGGNDSGDGNSSNRPFLWGPASWWRVGLVAMAMLILATIVLSIF